MKGPAGRAPRAAALLWVAALAGCVAGRLYRPASPHVAEEGGVHVEATEVASVERRKEPPATGVGARLTTDAPVRVDGVHLAASASEPCGAGPEPSRSERRDADGRNERPLAGDVAAGTIRLGALFPMPPETLAPDGPGALDLTLARGGATTCLRVPLAPAGPDGWREPTGVFVGVATRGMFGFASDGESSRRWLPIVGFAELPVGPGRASLEASDNTIALSGEAAILQRGGMAAVGSLGWEQELGGWGGPRVGLRLLRNPARTGWTGYRERPLAPAYGVDLYVSRWWSFASSDPRTAWMFAVGVSGEFPFPVP